MQTNICNCTGACRQPPYRCAAMPSSFVDPNQLWRPSPERLHAFLTGDYSHAPSKPYAKKKVRG